MGEDIPTLPPGDEKSAFDCPACYAAGETPKYLRVTFVGVTLCPGFSWPGGIDLNRTWWLTSVAQCLWGYVDANWSIAYVAAGAFPACTLQARTVPGNKAYFFRDQRPFCTAFFVNGMQLPCQFTDGAWGGTGDLS